MDSHSGVRLRRGSIGMLVLVIGCASARVTAEAESGTPRDDREVVGCSGACATEWQRAEAWVTQRARLPVVISGDSIIRTAPQTRKYPIYHFVATRSASRQGSAITLSLRCGNRMGCRPTADVVRSAFRQFVLTGIDSMPAQSRFAGIRD